MELIGELIAYLIFRPFFSFCQALAGILTPTDCAHLVRLQKLAAILLVFGVIATLGGFSALSFSFNGWICLWSLVAGFILLVVAGVIGHHIEVKAKEQAP